jgi:uncharacterized protein with NAD-binding domain and iron-sulfur cluster
MMGQRVVILGGGVAGLSAAHELAERGFQVSVFDRGRVPGGKARSFGVRATSARRNLGPLHAGRSLNGRYDLPAEHGFRFFASFYRHVIDTMRRIPYARDRSVYDNLVDTSRLAWAFLDSDRLPVEVPDRLPRTPGDLRVFLSDVAAAFDPHLGITWAEKAFFAERTWQILTSCRERRQDEYEKLGWWDYVGAATRSPGYQKLFAIGFTRQMVAARAELASTKTVGDVYMQLLWSSLQAGAHTDRVLNGPTNQAWIDPWLDYLRRLGVDYRLGSTVRSINADSSCVTSVTVDDGARSLDVQADYYVAALPVEAMARLVNRRLVAIDPALASIEPLSHNVAWMNGVQFYLTEDVRLAPGHVIYVDSPWALTSISQQQFWTDYDLRQYSDGRVGGIISVDVSDWDQPGLFGKPARECTRAEIRREVWEQMKRSLNTSRRIVLRDESLHTWSLDPDIDVVEHTNAEPLLVNYVDTWRLRPEAVTGVPNLFLAADYVRTYTDLATMEGANEAARRAVNGILDRSGSDAPRCRLWQVHDPEVFEPLRIRDRLRYQRGLPWDDRVSRAGLAAVGLAGDALQAGLASAPASLKEWVARVLGDRPSDGVRFVRW